jgi:membrane protein implicated in regulation of membrane protease activity
MVEGIDGWWTGITLLEKIFWIMAIPFSLLTLFQLVMTFVGMGDTDVDTDTDIPSDGDHHYGDSLKVFTVKNFIIFFTACGWMGIVTIRSGFPTWLVGLVAVFSGILMMVLVAWIFYLLSRLGESGTFRIHDAIGHNGSVYLTIPPQKQGRGLIQISVKGALRELAAVTYEDEELKRGTNITVVEIFDPNTVMVIKSI